MPAHDAHPYQIVVTITKNDSSVAGYDVDTGRCFCAMVTPGYNLETTAMSH